MPEESVSNFADVLFDTRLSAWSELELRRLETGRLLNAWQWKSSLSADFPLIACLMGGTGTGKSTLFNSLAGREISEVGTRRPCTRQAVILCDERWAGDLALCPCLGTAQDPSSIVTHRSPDLTHLILVDSPDFDSVQLENRRTAEDFFIISDLVVFVTSQGKYGDLAGHEVLERAVRWGKEIIVVMNRVASTDAFDDFHGSLKTKGFVPEPVRVESVNSFPTLIPGLRDREEFSRLFRSEKTAQQGERIRTRELSILREQTASGLEELEEMVDAQAKRIAALNERIKVFQADAGREMELRLDIIVTRDVEAHIQQRLSQLLRKYDILYVPRMMVRSAVKKIFHTVWDFVGGSSGPAEGNSRDDEMIRRDLEEAKPAARLKPVEEAVAHLNRQVAEALSSDPSLDDLRKVALTDVKRFDGEKIRGLYDEAFPGIEHLLEEEFKHFRDGLSTGDEMKLYGSYTLWALVMITFEIVVGGGFTLLDAVLDTVIMPFIPKWLLNLKILDVLREMGRKVDEEHRKALRGILDKQAELYGTAFSGLIPDEEARAEMRRLREGLRETVSKPATAR